MIVCDTSTIAKFYIFEPESTAVRERLEREDAVCVSGLVRTELMGVFHRRLREGKWTRDEFSNAVRQFSSDDLSGYWTWLPLDDGVAEAAAKTFATLPADIFLRSSDCLHLVTAIRHNFAEVFTHDKHQTLAASALGLKAIVINTVTP